MIFTGNRPEKWERRALLCMDVVRRNLLHAGTAKPETDQIAERPLSGALFDALF